MKSENTAADFIACVAILLLAISSTINMAQWQHSEQLAQINLQLKAQVETMERTLLLQR